MAAKRRASRRAARKEKSGERTAVELIRVNKMHIKANTGFRRKAFSGESAWKLKIAYSKRLALRCPAIRTFQRETSVLPVIRPESEVMPSFADWSIYEMGSSFNH